MSTGAPVTWARVTTPGSSRARRPRKGTSTARARSCSSGGAAVEIDTPSVARGPEAHGVVVKRIVVVGVPGSDVGDGEAAGVQHRQPAGVGAEVGGAQDGSPAR